MILVETLVPLGLTVGDTLRLVRDLAPRDIGVRILAGSILVDTSNPGLPGPGSCSASSSSSIS